MQYSFQPKQIDTLFTVRQKCADKVFQIVMEKSQYVSRNKTTLTYNAQHVDFRTFLFSHKIFTATNKIHAPKENQCMTLWLLDGFLSRQMINLFFDRETRLRPRCCIDIHRNLGNKILPSRFSGESSYFGEI